MDKLKFSARLNSFYAQPNIFWEPEKKIDTLDLIDRIATVEGLEYIELNYSQHFHGHSIEKIKKHINQCGLKISGIQLRYDNTFYNGEFTNIDENFREKAIRFTNEAINICKQLGGTTTTIWFSSDGFDYPFQLNYLKAWSLMMQGFKEVAKANTDMKISIEYKPYEPRTFYMIGDIGTALLMVEDVKCENIGVTLDFCHMLMKKENPAYSLSLAAERGKLFGIHINDGYGDHDDGLMIGSVHFLQTIEFIYYLKKYGYNGLIYFDTFTIREDPVKECEMNIRLFKLIYHFIDKIGEKQIAKLIENRNAIEIQKLFLNIGI